MCNWFLVVVLFLLCLVFVQEIVDSGDIVWIFIFIVFVLFMMLFGLLFFYGGLVCSKNVLLVFMQCFVIVCGVLFIWLIVGYSLVFIEGNSFIGDLLKVFFDGVIKESLLGIIFELLFFMF